MNAGKLCLATCAKLIHRSSQQHAVKLQYFVDWNFFNPLVRQLRHPHKRPVVLQPASRRGDANPFCGSPKRTRLEGRPFVGTDDVHRMSGVDRQ